MHNSYGIINGQVLFWPYHKRLVQENEIISRMQLYLLDAKYSTLDREFYFKSMETLLLYHFKIH